ncbi:fasciclin domain-containing protein [Candidatus Saccharibacteria bacterium]|nr:fasciclin domain-containing protein [Candidatus Saccharibacteria bacterium]MBP7834618.1 fasciclin domain-containing protein [Candidatus Saccharibacteria bacterium]
MATQSHTKKIVALSIVIIILLGGISLFIVTISKYNSPVQTETTVKVNQDKVPTETVSALISSNKDLSKFEKYLKDTGQYTLLESTDPYTVLAFSNEGYDNAEKSVKDLFSNESKAPAQKDIISYHIINGNIKPDAMTEGQKLKTTNGSEVIIKVEDKDIYVIDMKGDKHLITKAGIPAKNGSIYIIDGILLPQ